MSRRGVFAPVVLFMEQHYKPIDLAHLDACCATHLDYYHSALTDLSRVRHELGQAQDSIRLRSAEIGADTRRQYDADKVKYTEGSIGAIVEAHEDVITLRVYIRDKELEVATLAAQVAALDRSVQLGNLVRLRAAKGGTVEKTCCAG